MANMMINGVKNIVDSVTIRDTEFVNIIYIVIYINSRANYFRNSNTQNVVIHK